MNSVILTRSFGRIDKWANGQNYKAANPQIGEKMNTKVTKNSEGPRKKKMVIRENSCKIWRSVSAILIVFLYASGCEQATQPAVGTSRYQIYYMTRTGEFTFDLVRMDSEGRQKKIFSDSPPIVGPPVVSPDGNKLLYLAMKGEHQYDFHMMGADGDNPRFFNIPTLWTPDYAISPDGTQILLSTILGDRISFSTYLMDIDGSNFRCLPRAECIESFWPRFSPDGTKVIFASRYRDENTSLSNLEIATVNIDGTNVQRLTTNSDDDRYPRYTPTGEKIVFERSGSAGGYYSMNADGSNETFLMDDANDYGDYALSPDGTSMAYVSVHIDAEGGRRIYLLDLESGNRRAIAKGEMPLNVTFSQDGSELLFVTPITDNPDVFKFVLETGELVRLTNDDRSNIYPVYRPD